MPNLLPVLAACVLTGLVLWQARDTLEWGNRLFHRGKIEDAAGVYASGLDREEEGLMATYNLGTALLELGSDEAERYLGLAVDAPNSAVAQRAHYNLGYRLLTGADGSADPVSASALLIGAIDNFRAALKLDPSDEAARWNLALAQQKFENLPRVSEEGPAERTVGEDGLPPEEREGTGADAASGAGPDPEGLPPDDPGSREGAEVGAPETLLGTDDPGPLTELSARRLLDGLEDSPERVIQAVFWSQRPAVVPPPSYTARPEIE